VLVEDFSLESNLPILNFINYQKALAMDFTQSIALEKAQIQFNL